MIAGPGATVQIAFIITPDSLANEANETFSLRLSYNRTLFLPTDDLSADELNVTIIDGDGKPSMKKLFCAYIY